MNKLIKLTFDDTSFKIFKKVYGLCSTCPSRSLHKITFTSRYITNLFLSIVSPILNILFWKKKDICIHMFVIIKAVWPLVAIKFKHKISDENSSSSIHRLGKDVAKQHFLWDTFTGHRIARLMHSKHKFSIWMNLQLIYWVNLLWSTRWWVVLL